MFCFSDLYGLPPKNVMHQGKLAFAQLMLYLPMSTFRRCVADHRGRKPGPKPHKYMTQKHR